MKKLLIVFSCILMLFAIVACNQSGPEVKPDAFEEANQAIPSSNVDMNDAKDVTEDQTAAFTADFAKAQTQITSGVVGYVLQNGSDIDWVKVLEFYLGGGTAKALDEGSEDPEATVKVDIVSMAGTISFESDKLVFEGEADEKYIFSGISVDATLAGKTISITATGKLEGDDEPFNLSATITLDTSSENPIDIKFSDEDAEKIGEITGILSESTLADSKNTNVKVNGLKAILSIKIAGIETPIPVTVSVDGDVLLTTEKKGEDMRVIVRLDSFKATVESWTLGNVTASIKGLDFGITITSTDNEVSISVSEISISGELLPLMDNIRLRAKVKNLTINASGIVSVGSVEATVLGYKNISIAANITGFKTTTSDFLADATFDFGAAVSFESQTIGIRGEYFHEPLNLITTLNGSPVTKDSLIELVVGTINPTPDGDDRV